MSTANSFGSMDWPISLLRCRLQEVMSRTGVWWSGSWDDEDSRSAIVGRLRCAPGSRWMLTNWSSLMFLRLIRSESWSVSEFCFRRSYRRASQSYCPQPWRWSRIPGYSSSVAWEISYIICFLFEGIELWLKLNSWSLARWRAYWHRNTPQSQLLSCRGISAMFSRVHSFSPVRLFR